MAGCSRVDSIMSYGHLATDVEMYSNVSNQRSVQDIQQRESADNTQSGMHQNQFELDGNQYIEWHEFLVFFSLNCNFKASAGSTKNEKWMFSMSMRVWTPGHT